MGYILNRLMDMLRLRSGPQDMPFGWALAIILTFAYIVEGFVADYMTGDPSTAPRSLLAISVQFLITAVLLTSRGKGSRLPQTISALSGVGLLFGLASILLLSLADPAKNQPGLALIWFGVFLWSLAVDAHIYRRALSITMSSGVLIAVLIFAVNFTLIQALFR